ncbi:MAG: HPF/RaiA family ribosome-associated protein [Novipirellula sp. JB048]
MKLDISSNRIVIGNALRDYIEERLTLSFQRLERWVQKVSVGLDDINGPRGGVCKQCRVVVTLKGAEPVVVTEIGDNVRASLSRAIRRAAYALKRRVKAKQQRRIRQMKGRHATSTMPVRDVLASDRDDALNLLREAG